MLPSADALCRAELQHLTQQLVRPNPVDQTAGTGNIADRLSLPFHEQHPRQLGRYGSRDLLDHQLRASSLQDLEGARCISHQPSDLLADSHLLPALGDLRRHDRGLAGDGCQCLCAGDGVVGVGYEVAV